MIDLTYITLKQFGSAMHTIKRSLDVKMNTMINSGDVAAFVENQVIIIISDVILADNIDRTRGIVGENVTLTIGAFAAPKSTNQNLKLQSQ